MCGALFICHRVLPDWLPTTAVLIDTDIAEEHRTFHQQLFPSLTFSNQTVLLGFIM